MSMLLIAMGLFSCQSQAIINPMEPDSGNTIPEQTQHDQDDAPPKNGHGGEGVHPPHNAATDAPPKNGHAGE